LQEGALDRSVPVSDLLRKAKVVAAKLGLTSLSQWADRELNGYKSGEEVPSYREVYGQVKGWNPMRGWVPVMYEDPRMQAFESKNVVTQAVAEIEDLLTRGDGSYILPYGPRKLAGAGFRMTTDVALELERACFVGLLDAVRNAILNWSLELEKAGIRGEGVAFSKQEKAKAGDPKVSISIGHIEHFTGNVGEISGGANISSTMVMRLFRAPDLNPADRQNQPACR